MAPGRGSAAYLLFVNGTAVGVEAKPAGYPVFNVELQVSKYAHGLPAGLNPPVEPLPFQYISTGVQTAFINGLDPEPKTQPVSANLPQIHRPETLTGHPAMLSDSARLLREADYPVELLTPTGVEAHFSKRWDWPRPI